MFTSGLRFDLLAHLVTPLRRGKLVEYYPSRGVEFAIGSLVRVQPIGLSSQAVYTQAVCLYKLALAASARRVTVSDHLEGGSRARVKAPDLEAIHLDLMAAEVLAWLDAHQTE
jgi:hypothetical protein